MIIKEAFKFCCLIWCTRYGFIFLYKLIYEYHNRKADKKADKGADSEDK